MEANVPSNPLTYSMSQEIIEAESRYRAVQKLIFSTFDALWDCYDAKHGQFPASVQKTGGNPPPNFRDTAIVLLAIESAAKVLMNQSSDRKHSYDDYRHKIFEGSFGSLHKLTTEPDKVLDPKWPSGSDKDPEAFTCALMLELLALRGTSESFGPVFVEAVECVLHSLTRSYPPHYAFGGASIMGTEPNAFVTYHALRALRSISKSVRGSADQHRVLDRLTHEIRAWSNDPQSRERATFPNENTFVNHILEELDRMPDGIGLWEVIAALKNVLKKGVVDKPLRLNDCWGPALAEGITKAAAWLNDFRNSIKTVLDRPTNPRPETLPFSADARPGLKSMQEVRKFREQSGTSWKRGFFEGMLDVLDRIKREYDTTSGDPCLKDLEQSFRTGADIWSETAEWTYDYVAKFSKWAVVELHNQLALATITHKTNFDPSQIAFLLWIYQTFAPEKNPRLIDKGLEVLFQAQEDDGTWPVGAPFWFDRKTQVGVYVANIEVVNAVMPLLIQRGLERYRKELDKIFNWVVTNQRKVELPSDVARPRIVHGWSTDKIFERERLDVWMTAAVLHFLNLYGDLLQDFITRKTLQGRYDYVDPPREEWSRVIEPIMELGREGAQIKRKIFTSYIQSYQLHGGSTRNSMLLYGPPGTSKSTIAKAIAGELHWRLVTITPSDFIKEGIDKSESMARTLFQDLRRLRNVVVLFDEIDEMLQSRDDTDKDRSGGIAMLRFIVPGMLPKLQDLKQYGQTAGLIIIIATNYRDRLDAAVKRKGRIDDHFPVLPPDQEARRLLLDDFLKERFPDRPVEQRGNDARRLATITPGWVFAELKQLAEGIERVEDLAFYQFEDSTMEAGEARIILNENTISARGLNPVKFYARRGMAAREEAFDVFKICWPSFRESTILKDYLGTVTKLGKDKEIPKVPGDLICDPRNRKKLAKTAGY